MPDRFFFHMDSSGRKEKDRKKETLREKFKKEPFLIVTYFLLRMIVIVVMVLQARNGNYMNVFLCLLTLLLFTVPSFIEHRLRIDIPNTLEIIVLIFIFSAEILGEIRSYYTLYKGWDTALHTVTGFLTATVGFSLVDLLKEFKQCKALSIIRLSVLHMFFHDHRGPLGVFRIRHGLFFPYGYAERQHHQLNTFRNPGFRVP